MKRRLHICRHDAERRSAGPAHDGVLWTTLTLPQDIFSNTDSPETNAQLSRGEIRPHENSLQTGKREKKLFKNVGHDSAHIQMAHATRGSWMRVITTRDSLGYSKRGRCAGHESSCAVESP